MDTWTPSRIPQAPIGLFVCLFVGINPEKLYSASRPGREVNPLDAWMRVVRLHSTLGCLDWTLWNPDAWMLGCVDFIYTLEIVAHPS